MPPDFVSQLLHNFPKSFFAALLLNGAVFSLAYFIFWHKLKARLRSWRIQVKERVDGAQIRRELKNALYVLAVGAGMSCVVLYLASQGYTRLYQDPAHHSWWYNFGGFFLLLLIDDTWFYWCHRLLHHRVIYRYVHAEHHKSVDVNPFTSTSFHFLEPLLLTLWIVPVAFLVPVYTPVLALVQVWGLLDNLKSHLGYELYPAGFNQSWLRFLTTSTFHNMHHSRFNGNYGVHFRIWDWLLKTELPHYETEYAAIQARKKQPRPADS